MGSRLVAKPSSLQSDAHKSLTVAVRQRTTKKAKIAAYMTEEDPEKLKQERIKYNIDAMDDYGDDSDDDYGQSYVNRNRKRQRKSVDEDSEDEEEMVFDDEDEEEVTMHKKKKQSHK